MVEPELTRGMVEYVLWQCLFHHRKVWELEAAQSCATWRPHTYPAPWERTIGIMGLGELGTAAAAKLVEFGFKVRGWSRSPKSMPRRSRASTALSSCRRSWPRAKSWCACCR